LVFDEYDNPVETASVGEEPMYVVDDQGFRRHISAESIDRAVLEEFSKMIEGNEKLLSAQALKMIGQEDFLTKAMIDNQLKNLDQHFDNLLETGFPEEARYYLGAIGFKIRINHHGEVLEVIQPATEDPGDDY
jgi:uncharacterized protein YjaZ